MKEEIVTENTVPITSGERQISLIQAELLAELQVPLVLELARLSISVADLLDLVPGQLLHLPFEPTEQIGLFIAGEKIGTGRLVIHQDLISLEIRQLHLGEQPDSQFSTENP